MYFAGALTHNYDQKASVARLMAARFETMETVVNKRVHHNNTAILASDYLCGVPEYKARAPNRGIEYDALIEVLDACVLDCHVASSVQEYSVGRVC